MRFSVPLKVFFALVVLNSASVCSAFDCYPSSEKLKEATDGIADSSDGVEYTPDSSLGDFGPIEGWCFEDAVENFEDLFLSKTAFNAAIGG
jgi:hypothetical protein